MDSIHRFIGWRHGVIHDAYMYHVMCVMCTLFKIRMKYY